MADATSVKNAVAEAAEMVRGLPEAIQSVAFSKAFDALVNTGSPPTRSPSPRNGDRGGHRAPSGGASQRRSEEGANSGSSEAVTTVLESLNRTEHPSISGDRKALDLALLVLRAARDECQIESLTPGEISAVLKKKFNLPVEPPAVRMALKAARKYVDKKPAGQAYTYRLMQPGDQYLDELTNETATERKTAPSKVSKE